MGNKMTQLVIVVGTRPEIIKLAPVIKTLEQKNINFTFIHTGQHYDYEMSKIFIEELGLPKPDISFILNNRNPAAQIGEIMIKLEKILEKNNFKIMIIQGDTNSMLASGLIALKLGIRIGHVEAGLRSYDWRMPEEHNRRMIDHVSNYLFAPTELAKNNLLNEKVWGEVYVTGNTIIDAINIYFNKINDEILNLIKFTEYGLVTFHRSENVDDPYILRKFIQILEKSPIPLVFVVHPRTKKRLIEFNLWKKIKSIKHLQLLPPLGYFKFLALMKNARIILTDSGGLQEEATHPKIRKFVLILRSSTERPEAIEAGFAKLVGIEPDAVLSNLKEKLNEDCPLPNTSPFGDGKAARRIVNILERKLE